MANRIAVDTTVLVRYIVWDDPAQAELATALMEGDDDVVVSPIVFCETAWVLRRFYRLSNSEIADAFRSLMGNPRITTDPESHQAGLAMLDDGGDYADGCVLVDAGGRESDWVATFDRKLVRRSRGAARLLA